jgi:hypothetical protein
MTEARKARRLARLASEAIVAAGVIPGLWRVIITAPPAHATAEAQPAVTIESPRLPRPPKSGVHNSRDGRPPGWRTARERRRHHEGTRVMP